MSVCPGQSIRMKLSVLYPYLMVCIVCTMGRAVTQCPIHNKHPPQNGVLYASTETVMYLVSQGTVTAQLKCNCIGTKRIS